MKAIVQDGYGSPDVLHFKEIDRPVVKDEDVLVRVHAAALHAGDYFAMRGEPYLVRVAVGLAQTKGLRSGIRFGGACRGRRQEREAVSAR